jgi:hypothetical protein
LFPHLKNLILKAFQQICGSSGSNLVKNKNVWNATWGMAPACSFGGESLNRNQIVIVEIWLICSFFVSLLRNH